MNKQCEQLAEALALIEDYCRAFPAPRKIHTIASKALAACEASRACEAGQARPAVEELQAFLNDLNPPKPDIEGLVMALEGMLHEWDKFTRYGSPIAKASNENVNRARAALAAYEASQPHPDYRDELRDCTFTEASKAEITEQQTGARLVQAQERLAAYEASKAKCPYCGSTTWNLYPCLQDHCPMWPTPACEASKADRPVYVLGLRSLKLLASGQPAEGSDVIVMPADDFPKDLFAPAQDQDIEEQVEEMAQKFCAATGRSWTSLIPKGQERMIGAVESGLGCQVFWLNLGRDAVQQKLRGGSDAS